MRSENDRKSVRLNKFLAERLGLSRREADEIIGSGKVTINGDLAVLGARVNDEDEVRILEGNSSERCGLAEKHKSIDFSGDVCYNDGMEHISGAGVRVSRELNYVYLALNKPVGYVCSRKRQGEAGTIYELLPKKYQRLKTVGRLDKDSSGLILLTNDGDFAFQMTHPSFIKSKEYIVKLDRALEPLHQQMITDFGIEIGDGASRLGLERLDDGRKKWKVVMSEGRNRQIRRTFGALGYTVVDLHRIRFGRYNLGSLKTGSFEEVEKFL